MLALTVHVWSLSLGQGLTVGWAGPSEFWGQLQARCTCRVPYGSTHHPEERGRETTKPGQEGSSPPCGLGHRVLSLRQLNCPYLPMTAGQGWNSAGATFGPVLMRHGGLTSVEKKQGLGSPRIRPEWGLPTPSTSSYRLYPPCVPSWDELLHSKPRDYFTRGCHW